MICTYENGRFLLAAFDTLFYTVFRVDEVRLRVVYS